MQDQIEHPVIKTDEQEAKFLEAAALVDAGRDIPADLVPSAAPEAVTEKKEEPVKSEEQSGKKDERPRDAQGRFTKTESGEDIPEAERKPAEQPKKEEPKPGTSEYEAKKQERAQKDQQPSERRISRTRESVGATGTSRSTAIATSAASPEAARVYIPRVMGGGSGFQGEGKRGVRGI
jgi:hypothetical protein